MSGRPAGHFDRVGTARELRVIDIFDEVGYLAAECTLMGRPDLASGLMTGLQDAGFAPPTPALQTTCALLRLVSRSARLRPAARRSGKLRSILQLAQIAS